MPRSPQDIYARHLLSPRGYPLWMPDPSRQFLAYRREGLRIGDVGVVVPENGSFDVYFNLCLPHDHPFHQATGVPDNFKPIRLSEMDIRTATNAENPGRIIATSSVKTANIEQSEDATSSKTQLSTLEYEFSLSSSEDALLILPDGAECEDLRNHRLFLEAAVKHGADWYRFAEEKVGQIIDHDSLYLITGLHKTLSWSVAAFEGSEGSEECPTRCRLPQRGGGNLTTTSTWNMTRSLDWRVGPDVDNDGIPNQTVFIRGFKIAQRTRMFGKRISVKADVPSTRSSGVNDLGAVRGSTWWSNILGSESSDRGTRSSRSDMQDEIAVDSGPHDNQNRNYGALVVSKDIVIQRVPEASQAFHPSDMINQYLLNEEPSANIAITHDDEWIALLQKDMLRSDDLAQASLLEELVSNNYHLVSDAGAVYLRSRDPSVSDASKADATVGKRKRDYDTAIAQDISLAELGDTTNLDVPRNTRLVKHCSSSSSDTQRDQCAVRFSNVRAMKAGNAAATSLTSSNKTTTMFTTPAQGLLETKPRSTSPFIKKRFSSSRYEQVWKQVHHYFHPQPVGTRSRPLPQERGNEGYSIQQPTPTGSFVSLPDADDLEHAQLSVRGSHWVTEVSEIISTRDLGPDDIVIAVMGPTGSGKTTFVCSATGCDDKAIGDKLRSYTDKVGAVKFWDKENRRHVVLVDTPGFDDTYKSDLDILTLISEWLVSSYNNQKLLSGILYLHRITDNRLAGPSLKNLRLFQKLCGRDALDKVYLTATMWDEVELGVGERRLDKLKTEYWTAMIAQGARVARCRSDDKSLKKLIRKIILSEIGGTLPLQSPYVETPQGPSSHSQGETWRFDIPRGGTLGPKILSEQGGPPPRQPRLVETRRGRSSLFQEIMRIPRGRTLGPEILSEQGGPSLRQPPLVETQQGPSSHLPEKSQRNKIPLGGTLVPEILAEQGGPPPRQPPLIKTRQGPSSRLQEKPQRHDIPQGVKLALKSPPIEYERNTSSHSPQTPQRRDIAYGGPPILQMQAKNSEGSSSCSPQILQRCDGNYGGIPMPRPPAENSQRPSLRSQTADDVLADAMSRLSVSGKNTGSHGKALVIQDGMADLKKELKETAAGQQLYSQLETLVEKQLVLAQRIEKEKKAASDCGIVEELQREYDDLRVQTDNKLRQMRESKPSWLKRFIPYELELTYL